MWSILDFWIFQVAQHLQLAPQALQCNNGCTWYHFDALGSSMCAPGITMIAPVSSCCGPEHKKCTFTHAFCVSKHSFAYFHSAPKRVNGEQVIATVGLFQQLMLQVPFATSSDHVISFSMHTRLVASMLGWSHRSCMHALPAVAHQWNRNTYTHQNSKQLQFHLRCFCSTTPPTLCFACISTLFSRYHLLQATDPMQCLASGRSPPSLSVCIHGPCSFL